MACGRGMVPGVGIPGLGAGFGVPDFVGSVKVGVAALAGVAIPPGFGMLGFAAVPAPGFGGTRLHRHPVSEHQASQHQA